MAINIIESSEPQTHGPVDGEPLLIDSSASRTLVHELKRYCNKQVSGRSFLIAGHRGSGKTTIMLNAFSEVLQESYKGVFELRPLLVLLQGPNLLPNPEEGGIAEPRAKAANAFVKQQAGGTMSVAEFLQHIRRLVLQFSLGELPGFSDVKSKPSQRQPDSDAKEGVKRLEVRPDSTTEREAEAQKGGNHSGTKAETAAPEMENVLKQIILGLYRALADEISRAFRREMTERAKKLERVAALRKDEIYNLLELAAELELELDEYPGQMRLREFWHRAGVLREGVLFRDELGRPYFGIHPLDQGLRELLALCTASEAYRRISGTIKTQEQIKSGAQAKEETQVEFDSKGRDLLAPLIPLLSGGAAAAGALVINPLAQVGAVLAGFVTALATAVTLKYSTSRSRERSATREDFFIPDLSIATLDRVLPVLISRVRDAGLTPVFVVDELDKVSDLSDRITDMVRRLKKLVAENAYFCFLTDRTYFEQVRQRGLKNPYSIEYTYYSDQLFVTFRHQELHEFLSKVLKVDKPARPVATPAITGGTAAGETLQTIEAEKRVSDEEADAAVLPFILLHWSQMHAIDLRRRLGAIRDAEGNVNLSLGAVRTRPYYRLQVTIQVAIEILLEDPKMESELEAEPSFRRLAHDALYYISREWRDAPKELRLDDATETIAAFEKYLCDRMATDPSSSAQEESGTLAEESRSESRKRQPEPPTIDPARLDFLLSCVRELASLLAFSESPEDRAKEKAKSGKLDLEDRAKEKAKSGKLDQRVLHALSEKPLLRPVNGEPLRQPPLHIPDARVYCWCFYRSGRDVIEGEAAERAPEVAPARETWKTEAAFIRALKEAIANLTSPSVDFVTLSSQYGVIPTSPAWANVEVALERLEKAEETHQPYSDQDVDVSVVNDFSKLLKANGEVVALALACGAAIGGFSHVDPPDHIVFGLKVISDAFRFLQVGVEEASRILRDLESELRIRSPVQGEIQDVPQLTSKESVIGWQDWFRNAAQRLDTSLDERAKAIRHAQGAAWDGWLKRFQDPSALRPPLLDDLICEAAEVAPAKLLKFDFASMNLGDWSRAFYQCAVVTKPPSETDDPPRWFALAALERLGFAVEGQPPIRFLELLGGRNLNPEELELLSRWKPLNSPARRDFSVLICTLVVPKTTPNSPSESIAAQPLPASQWPLSTLCAGMVLGPQEIDDLCKRGPSQDNIFRLLGVNQLAFEVAVDAQESPVGASSDPEPGRPGLPSEIDAIRKSFTWITTPKIALIVPDRPAAEYPPPYFPFIAQNLDELSRKMGLSTVS